MNDETTAQIVEACAEIVELVEASPQGVPCEMAFAALKQVYPAMTRWQFNYTLIDTLVEAGKLKCIASHLYTPKHANFIMGKASNTKQ